ncbi:hypothetical protein P7K49_014574 [Saguinus oedipus]|uniref:Uncharacterized protein n=1 Tax=Saguinus oedipus TaxID=9490 RepID=A0ABQ9V7L4_SAGOE|nr:hypothetical protein P7K49_014574 [Saguinus oedipus]
MATEGELLLLQFPKLFKTSKQLLDKVEVVIESAGSWIVQEKMFKDLNLLEKAAKMLLQLDLFSQNEDLEEIASTDLKYLFESELPKAKNNSAENYTANFSMVYPGLIATSSQRQTKIERYKQKKDLEHRVSAMESAVESG